MVSAGNVHQVHALLQAQVEAGSGVIGQGEFFHESAACAVDPHYRSSVKTVQLDVEKFPVIRVRIYFYLLVNVQFILTEVIYKERIQGLCGFAVGAPATELVSAPGLFTFRFPVNDPAAFVARYDHTLPSTETSMS